jgi:hypothetical protein
MNEMEIVVKQADSLEELQGIQALNTANLKANVSKDIKQTEGFVSVEYDVKKLEIMNQMEPCVIAKDGDHVIGYVLATPRKYYGVSSLIDECFDATDNVTYDNMRLGDVNFLLVGQLCIAKDYRGIGLVERMYKFYRQCYQGKYPLCLTYVDEKNPRSLRAHLKSGFQVVESPSFSGESWKVVLWDWRN